MFGIGDQELFLIILFAFLLFGPDKLPGMGRTIGRALRQFRTAQEGVTKVVQSEIIDPIQNVAETSTGKAAAKAKAEDEDMTEEEVAAAKPAETFAERRARLAAALVRSLCEMERALFTEKDAWLREFAAHCITIGQDVKLVRGDDVTYAHADAIDSDAALLVTLPDGTKSTIASGEVSVRGMYGYV